MFTGKGEILMKKGTLLTVYHGFMSIVYIGSIALYCLTPFSFMADHIFVVILFDAVVREIIEAKILDNSPDIKGEPGYKKSRTVLQLCTLFAYIYGLIL